MCKSFFSLHTFLHVYLTAFPCLFLVHPIMAYTSTAHGPFPWHDRTEIKPLNMEGESRHFSFYLWPALLNNTIHMNLTSSNHSYLFLLHPHLPAPLSPSIRQTWRSLWSMCSRGTLKRSQGSWKKAWTPTSTIQTREVRMTALRDTLSLSYSSYIIHSFTFVKLSFSFAFSFWLSSPQNDHVWIL